MKNLLARFVKDEGGATAIEYGLIAALISVVMVSVLVAVGPQIKGTFQDVDTNLQARSSL
ncbi:MAG TPA: Flp family type IVb pilin [Alphaproteobacteria bacterium]|nr:Flp family type IVb pilin [Alphaproteobacteria bacterium]